MASAIEEAASNLKSRGIDVSYLFDHCEEITLDDLLKYGTEKLSSIYTSLKNIETMYNKFQSAIRKLNKDKGELVRIATSKVLKKEDGDKEKFLHTLLDAINEGKNVFDAIAICQAVNELNTVNVDVSSLFKGNEVITVENLMNYNTKTLSQIYNNLNANLILKTVEKLKISIGMDVSYLFKSGEKITLENLMNYGTERLSSINTRLNNIIYMYNQVRSKLIYPNNQLSGKKLVVNYILLNLGNKKLNKEEFLKKLLDEINKGKNGFYAIAICQAVNELNKVNVDVSSLFTTGKEITVDNLMNYDTKKLSQIYNNLNANLILKTVEKLKISIGMDVSYLFISDEEITLKSLLQYDETKLDKIYTSLKNIETMYTQLCEISNQISYEHQVQIISELKKPEGDKEAYLRNLLKTYQK